MRKVKIRETWAASPARKASVAVANMLVGCSCYPTRPYPDSAWHQLDDAIDAEIHAAIKADRAMRRRQDKKGET